jgi:hypothetical protein
VAPRYIFAVFSLAFGLAVIFAVVTTVKHASATRVGIPMMRVG